jgi:hypothetical protein
LGGAYPALGGRDHRDNHGGNLVHTDGVKAVCCHLTTYLRLQSNRDSTAGTASTTRTQIWPADPARHLFTIRNDGSTILYFYFAYQLSTPVTFILNAARPQAIFNEEEHGALIKSPVYVFTPTGTVNYASEVLSYTQYAQEVIRKHVNRSLSQLGAL